MSERGFEVLARAHRAIDELLLRHQVALVEREGREADRILFLFGDSLRRHLEDEETLLFPALEGGDEIAGATREILLKEHERIRELLQQIETHFPSIEIEGPGSGERVVRLIDEEGVLKRLIEHHETREESLVFPALDQRVGAEERERLLEACWIPD